MLLNLIESYGSLIKSWPLDEFESAGPKSVHILIISNHKHINKGAGEVVGESKGGDLEEILSEISIKITSEK